MCLTFLGTNSESLSFVGKIQTISFSMAGEKSDFINGQLPVNYQLLVVTLTKNQPSLKLNLRIRFL